MPSSSEFKDFVLEQLESSSNKYNFSAKKMFGEYCVYVMGEGVRPKPIFFIIEDILYVKQFPELAKLLESTPTSQIIGSKEWYALDVDSVLLLQEVVETIVPILPEPKRRKPKKSKK